ncbi:MAG: hypothetical protein M0Z62_10410 [Actinomycetota bacterium]|jgi:hypothetical protein|nr:hypothetical protein [Actinomycetota bacterium]
MSMRPADHMMHLRASSARALAAIAAADVAADAAVSASGAVAVISTASLKGAGPVT